MVGHERVRMRTRGTLQHTQTPALDRSAIGTEVLGFFTKEEAGLTVSFSSHVST